MPNFLEASNYPDKTAIERLYRDARKPITDVSLFDAPDAVWPLLPKLKSAQSLDLTATPMSTAAWKSIGQMKGLRKIHFVNNNGALPSDLKHLSGLKNLENLDIMLDGYSASDDEITELVGQLTADEQQQIDEWKASVKSGRSTRVIEMAILTDRALPSLADLRNLRSLVLINTHCTGRGLAALRHLKQIEHYDVGLAFDAQEAAEVLGSWHQLKSIQSINLSDAIIAKWTNLSDLQKLGRVGRRCDSGEY